MADKQDKLKAFFSYSHSDNAWAERLMAHLSKAESKGLVEYWGDQELIPGSNWKEEIANSIKEAKIFVILVSPGYMASPFCINEEFPLIREAVDDGALVIPILIKPVPFSELQGLQNFQFANREPLQSLSPRQQEKLIIEVAEDINVAIIEHKRKTTSNSTQVLASVIGGAAIGSIFAPTIGVALIGGLLGGVFSNVSKEAKGGKDNAEP